MTRLSVNRATREHRAVLRAARIPRVPAGSVAPVLAGPQRVPWQTVEAVQAVARLQAEVREVERLAKALATARRTNSAITTTPATRRAGAPNVRPRALANAASCACVDRTRRAATCASLRCSAKTGTPTLGCASAMAARSRLLMRATPACRTTRAARRRRSVASVATAQVAAAFVGNWTEESARRSSRTEWLFP